MSSPYDPTTPVEVPCIYVDWLARYTHPDQYQYFKDTINWWYAQNANVRIDPEDPDGLRIRWYGYYFLEFGNFLYVCNTRTQMYQCTEAQMRFYTRPQPDWPDDLSGVFNHPPDFRERV